MKEAYCFHCKKLVMVKRRKAKNYCDNGGVCKQAAYRERKKNELS